MTTRFSLITAIFALFLAVPASAQIGVGGVQVGVPGAQDLPGRVLDPVLNDVDELTGEFSREVLNLAENRVRRLNRLVRRNRDAIERDTNGAPARRGELLVMDADAAAIMRAEEMGFRVLSTEEVEGLDILVTRLTVPRGDDLDDAQDELVELMPGATISADNLYFQSGSAAAPGSPAPQQTRGFSRGQPSAPVGMIDGAPISSIAVTARRGFAEGAGQASDHGSAVASLLGRAGVRQILSADVYGTDPAGGNALAIARAMGWLAQEGAEIVTISLVGPDNPVLARAIAAAESRGLVVVAAVGNDGPAAPPAFPASYDGVVAVTAVDRSERALIEAGRALHLDYAAPGADIYGLDRRGRDQRLRGTSYATPLVAARIARALGRSSNWRSALDSEAHDLGPRGADDTYGRGLVCRGCGARR